MYENELKRIIDASQNNALSFFVGAGVSALSGAPTWKGLINSICDKIGCDKKEKYSSEEYLQIPQMYYYSIGKDDNEYYSFVKKQLNTTNLTPNSIHREMFKLNPTSFITTNYDTLLEDASVQYCRSYKVVSCDEDVPTIFGDKYILKLHGDFKKNNIVLKEEDYLNYSENFKLIETLMKSIFSTNTVVFIGYGLNDYNIKLILNWSKSLLKSAFREPIFIYTDDAELTKEELLYHQSKGLQVVEWNKLLAEDNPDYLIRYQSVFDIINNYSMVSLVDKNEEEALSVLYNLLEPLDNLNALRIEDISKKLYPYVNISEAGVMYCLEGGDLLVKKFLEINQLCESERKKLSKDTIDKYNCIISVFKKARIRSINNQKGETLNYSIDELPLADNNCILFDYGFMNDYAKKLYKTTSKNYKKAFYLSRLKRYDEAFLLFDRVAKESYRNKDYLMYYLAESNCISLSKIILNTNTWYNCYDMDLVNSKSLSNSEIEELFHNLPVEFRKKYDTIKDLHSPNLLYKYSYDAFIDGQKLQSAIESNTIEFGLTSGGKAICLINNYLHFFLGNGIIADVFNEYKSTTKNLMSLLVYKYATQNNKVLHEQPFSGFANDEVCFDQIDFFCFVECFTDKEIRALFSKHQIETLYFHNTEVIEISVENLLNYYESAVKSTKNNIDVISIQIQIKKCLMLLRYMDISQTLVDRVCTFIFSYKFREILINDKIMFLDYQLARRKMYSETTQKIIENTLVSYIDAHISALKNNETFEVYSSSSEINYSNLADYLCSSEDNYSSRRISMRVKQIMSNEITPLYEHVMQHYCRRVSNNQKKKLVAWVNKKIIVSFDFKLFMILIQLDVPVKAAVKEKLIEFLREKIEKAKKVEKNPAFRVFPAQQQYEELINVGYWCFTGILNSKGFEEFVGNDALFDFYYEFESFDYSRFDVAWLINLTPYALKRISDNIRVKDIVRAKIAHELVNEKIIESDRKRLQDILTKYFC